MQLEVGNIVEGKVTGITNFGAFIALPEGKTGMIHISEISDSFVKDINDYLQENDEIKVEILSIADDGKIGLSIKSLHEENGITKRNQAPPAPRRQERPARRREEPKQETRAPGPPAASWSPRPTQTSDDASFEEMLTRFKQVSNDRIGDLKRTHESQRSGRSNYGGNRSQ